MIPHQPLVILVFGFTLAILLQAWFVRRTARLGTELQDRQDTYRELARDIAVLSEELTGFSNAIDANTLSIGVLQRETEELHERLAEFDVQDSPQGGESDGAQKTEDNPGHRDSTEAGTPVAET